MIKTAGHGIKCRSAHPLKPEFSKAGGQMTSISNGQKRKMALAAMPKAPLIITIVYKNEDFTLFWALP